MAGISSSSSGSGANNQEFIFSVKINYKDAISKIADFRQQIDDATKQQKEWAKAIKESEKELKNGTITQEEFAKRQQQYQQAVSASKIAVDEYKKSMREVEKQVKNQIADEKKQEGSLNQLRAQLSKATKAYDEMSRAERNSAKGQELQRHIKQITEELKSAEYETERYYRNVGNYKNAILEAMGVNGAFGNSVVQMAASGATATTMFEGMTVSIKAFGAACLGLLTNPVVMALAGIAGAGVAFKWWYDYNQGLAEATRLTKEFTGQTGDMLEHTVASIQATADQFGKEYLEVLQTMDSLMAQFHISSEQAMQAINDGFIAGADLSGNMLSNLQQYAPVFRDAGLSAEQMVAIIAQTRSGIFSEGGLDAIAMASKRIREMATGTKDSLKAIGMDADQIAQELSNSTITTFDVIQQISSKMKEFGKDSEEVGNIIKDVFGKNGAANGIEMLEMLDQMSLSIEDVKAVTGEYGELLQEQLDTDRELETVTMDLFAVQDGGFEAVTMKAMNFVKKGLLAIIKAFRDARNDWQAFVKRWEISTTAMGNMASAFGKGVKAVFADIAAGGGLVASAFGNIFSLDFDAAKRNFEAGMNKLKTSLQGKFDEMLAIGRKAQLDMNKVTLDLIKQEDYSDYDTSSPTNNGGGKGNGSGGGSKGGKSSSRGGSSRSSKGGSRSTTNSEREAQRQKREAERAAAEAKRKLEEARRISEQFNKDMAAIDKRRYDEVVAAYRKMLEVVTEGSQEQMRIELALLDMTYQHEVEEAQKSIVNLDAKDATLLALERKYAADRFAIMQKAAETELAEQQKAAETEYAMLENQQKLHGEQSEAIELAKLMMQQEQARLRIEARQAELEQLATIEGLSAEQRAEKQKEINEKIKADQQTLADAQVDIEVTKDQAIASAMSNLGQAMQGFASENTAFAKMGKVLALGELAINTGKALSSGISSAMSLPFPANLAAMATTIATVLANIATARKTIQSAKFATGGLVEGEGTGTSDSINARLSNGESVMTARATGMFAPLLSSINQMGGGVPISVSQTSSQAMGEEMLARAVAKGVAAVQPVVSVEEINKVSNRVKAIETLGNL